MKKIFLFLSTICFCCQFHGTTLSQTPKKVNYCDLFRTLKYDQSLVATQAVLYSSPDGSLSIVESAQYLYSPACNNRDFFALPDFTNAKNLELLQIKSNHVTDKLRALYLISFKGKLSISLQATYGNLSYLRAKFDVQEISYLREVGSKYALPDTDGYAPLIETSNSLRSINGDLIFYLLKNRPSSLDLGEVLSEDTKMYFEGKPVAQNALTRLFPNGNDDKLSIRIDNFSEKADEWKLIGTITKEGRDGSKAKLAFSSTYSVRDTNKTRLVRLEISSTESKP